MSLKKLLVIVFCSFTYSGFSQSQEPFTLFLFGNEDHDYIDHFDSIRIQNRFLDTLIYTTELSKEKGFLLKLPPSTYIFSVFIADYKEISEKMQASPGTSGRINISQNGELKNAEPLDDFAAKYTKFHSPFTCFLYENFNKAVFDSFIGSVSFGIEIQTDGTALAVHLPGTPEDVKKEWERVVALTGRWKPAELNGRARKQLLYFMWPRSDDWCK